MKRQKVIIYPSEWAFTCPECGELCTRYEFSKEEECDNENCNIKLEGVEG